MSLFANRRRPGLVPAVVLLGLLLSGLAAAQEAIIKGSVVDKDGAGLKAAVIALESLTSGHKFSFKSGKDGKIFKIGIPAGQYALKVTLEGYLPYEQAFTLGFSEEHVLNVTLEKVPPKLDEDEDFQAGIAFFRDAKYAEAVASFERVTTRFPEVAEGFFNLGLSALKAGERDKGVQAMETAARLAPDMVEAHAALGEAYFAAGDKDGAVRAFRRATELKPEDPGAHYNLGMIFYKFQMTDEALAEFRRAIELNPAMSSAHYQAALACVGKKDFAGAVEHFERFLALEPNAPETAQVKTMIEELRKQIGTAA